MFFNCFCCNVGCECAAALSNYIGRLVRSTPFNFPQHTVWSLTMSLLSVEILNTFHFPPYGMWMVDGVVVLLHTYIYRCIFSYL